MKNLLVLIGSSNNAKHHLQYALDFAKEIDAKLYIVQVYNVYSKSGSLINIDHLLEKESLNFLNRMVEQVDTKGVNIEIKTYKGSLVETIDYVGKKLEIDLVLIEPKTNLGKKELFLGKTSGKIVKQSQLPALIVPEKTIFKKYSKGVLAIKSTQIKKKNALIPLQILTEKFGLKTDLQLVKTSSFKTGDFKLNDSLESLTQNVLENEGVTTYQGLQKYLQNNEADFICVVRRKSGFFQYLFEKNTLYKKDFHSTIPVLVLKGLY